jgi:hypothetical protein
MENPDYEKEFYDKHEGIDFYRKKYPDLFGIYFKFACVRNPFEKVYSHYIFKRINRKKECYENDFNEWVEKYAFNDFTGNIFKAQLDFLYIDNLIAVDEILRYENLEEGLRMIWQKLNIKQNTPRLFPSCAEDYRNKYSTKSIEIVEKVFEKDLKYFGYKYGDRF